MIEQESKAQLIARLKVYAVAFETLNEGPAKVEDIHSILFDLEIECEAAAVLAESISARSTRQGGTTAV